MSTLVASQQALDDLIDPARVRKRWNKHDQRWADAAALSPKTLQRFWSRVSIKRANFIAICQAIDIIHLISAKCWSLSEGLPLLLFTISITVLP
ncbi:MAG: hypothetical protein KAF91_03470 [Nostoc sp. TH1S01]|nr:hypothetical protein [Nostoc sp. TH1S01]